LPDSLAIPALISGSENMSVFACEQENSIEQTPILMISLKKDA
jgi:hypothetical protein